MSLTKPFFSTIPAFDATIGSTLTFNVLGGDAIVSYTYAIYESKTNLKVTWGSSSVSDASTNTIRSFNIKISASVLLNDYSYNIIVTTTNSSGDSMSSNYQTFRCYIAPSIRLYRNSSGNNFVSLTSSYMLPSISQKVYPLFINNSSFTDVLLNKLVISFYGVDSNSQEELIQSYEVAGESVSTQTLVSATDNYSLIIEDLLPTNSANGVYNKYKIVSTATTVDNMVVSQTINNLSCSYPQSASSQISATNNCESGRIDLDVNITDDLSSYNINKYCLQFKKSDETRWITFSGSKDGYELSSYMTSFSCSFIYGINNTKYDFRIVLIDSSNRTRASYTTQIESVFNNSFICDNYHTYNITKEWSINSYAQSNQNSVYETLKSRYPIISKNAIQSYKEGQFTALLLTSLSQQSADIDRLGQTELKREFETWLSNGNAKIIKTFNGDIWLVNVTNTISSNYYKQLGNGVASTNFAWVECGYIENDLARVGLITNDIGLVFELNADNVSYSVMSGTAPVVAIPSYYDGLPVTGINNYAFLGNNTLASVFIPNTILSIGISAFDTCQSLSSVTFGSNISLKAIPLNCFSNCSALTSITIPDSVEDIGEKSFFRTGLQSVTFGTNVKTMGGQPSLGGSSVFQDAPITKVYVKNLENFCKIQCSQNDWPNFDKLNVILYLNGSEVTNLFIPKNITEIPAGIFFGYYRIASVVLPKGLNAIGTYAFYGCTSLETVYNRSQLELTLGATDNGYVAYYATQIIEN